MAKPAEQWTDEERQLVDWLADMNEDDALPLAKRMLLEDKVDPMRVLELCRAAMDIVGKRFEEGEYFLPELVLAGEMLDTIGAVAKPLIKAAGGGAAANARPGADRHGARRPARHRQEHRHLHARHQRLRGEGHRRRRAGADLHRRDQGLSARVSWACRASSRWPSTR
jgi:hypothetical protein